METTRKRWGIRILSVPIIFATIVLGHIVSYAIFGNRHILNVAFFVVWLIFMEFGLRLTCVKDGAFLEIRLVSFLFSEIAAILIVLKLTE